MSEKQNLGSVSWVDLTVDDADGVRDFYQAVVGWEASAESMGDYDDYCMSPAGQTQPVTGICHARGPNSDLPAQWLIYISVADLAAAIDACEERGGKVINGPRSAGGGQIAVIQDPAGAVCALYQTN